MISYTGNILTSVRFRFGLIFRSRTNWFARQLECSDLIWYAIKASKVFNNFESINKFSIRLTSTPVVASAVVATPITSITPSISASISTPAPSTPSIITVI